jgi:hypothetical protein
MTRSLVGAVPHGPSITIRALASAALGRYVIASVVALAGLASPLGAQIPAAVVLAPRPEAGALVRIRRVDSTGASASRPRKAEFLALVADTLIVHEKGNREHLILPLDGVATLEVRRKDRERGAFLGVFGGIILGLASVATIGVPASPSGPSDAILMMGVAGGALGAAFGWDTWRPVVISRTR